MVISILFKGLFSPGYYNGILNEVLAQKTFKSIWPRLKMFTLVSERLICLVLYLGGWQCKFSLYILPISEFGFVASL